MGLLDWIKDFKKHYKAHNVDYTITDYGMKVDITIELRDIPEEKARTIIEKLDEAIATLSKGKLPLGIATPKKVVADIKNRIAKKQKVRNSALITGIVD